MRETNIAFWLLVGGPLVVLIWALVAVAVRNLWKGTHR